MADERESSSSSTDLSALGHSVRKQQEGSAERAAYLESLRQKIKTGEYTVNAEALAQKILETIPDQVLPEEAFEQPQPEPSTPKDHLPEDDVK